MLEIGVNAGHSILIMLLANPNINIVCMDICKFKYVQPCIQYLNDAFGNKIKLIKGNSPSEYQRYIEDNIDLNFDLFHIDAYHIWNNMIDEIALTLSVSNPGNIIIMDDTNIIPHMFKNNCDRIETWKNNGIYESSAYTVTKKLETPYRYPTPLCKIALKYGTDKCREIKHNYTKFYHLLFQDRIHDVFDVLEIGIGTVELMGKNYKPGCSLYMWREYFPQANIIGLDINKEVLFKDENIRCYYCDQSDPKSLLKVVESQQFDIIIDDGSHVKEHQITSVNTLIPYVKSGGIYIIEDVKSPGLFKDSVNMKDIEFMEEFLFDPNISDDRLTIFWKK